MRRKWKTCALLVVLVQSLSWVWLFATLRTAACQASLSFAISQSLLKLMFIDLLMPSKHLILCRPLLPCLQSFPASGSFPMSQIFASHGQSIGASASASVLLINIQGWFPLGWTKPLSFRFDLAVQGTLKSLLQHHNSKASILRHPALLMV